MIHLKAKNENLIHCRCDFIINMFTITVFYCMYIINKPVVHVIAEWRHGILEKLFIYM